ncbi:MAG: hypothetical protein Q9166_001933 [cf. Caloplaca sp. 2 TL-2023]
MLSERLMAGVIDMYAHIGLETPVEQTWRLRTKDFVDIGQSILDLMKARGWCPYDLKRLEMQIETVSLFYYYSCLDAPRSSKDHSGCSDEQCLAMTTDPSKYKPSHHLEGCSCPLLYADQEEMARILRQGSIPLIAIVVDSVTLAPKINVQDISQAQDFVAISHVWAEGAGNVQDNALQSCLLTKISELVKKLPWDAEQKDFAFWIDTICVPVRPPELYTLALNQMRIPYERATHVLVLDSHLRSIDSTQLSSTEVFAQVSCSSWMRRLWTLQEGRLARTVWFQFANGAVNVKNVFDNLDRSRVPSRIEFWLDAAIYVQLWIQIWYRKNSIKNTGMTAGSISSTRLALASRSVSVPTDEALCLFTLLGMDMTRITAVSPTKRMEVFWRTFRKVPIGFLFSRASNKMQETGIHWAPSSFLGLQREKDWSGPQELSSPKESDPHALPTDLGLVVRLPGFTLHSGLIARMKDFDFTWNVDLIIQDEENLWYAMRVEEPWRQDSDVFETTQELAIVLAYEINDGSANVSLTGQSYETFSFQGFSAGLLVSIERVENETIYVKAHSHVVLELLGEGLQSYLSSAAACAREVNIPHSVLVGESHTALKERYKESTRKFIDSRGILGLLAKKARHFGMDDAYEVLLDDLLDTTVVAARFGDRCGAKKIPKTQSWCVD